MILSFFPLPPISKGTDKFLYQINQSCEEYWSLIKVFLFHPLYKIIFRSKTQDQASFRCKNLPSRSSKCIFAGSLVYLALHMKGVYRWKRKKCSSSSMQIDANQRQILPYQRFALCFITFYIALLGYLIASVYEKVSLPKVIPAGNQ